MAYNQKFGKERSNALADIAGKLKQGSGLGSTSDSAATMYGAPVHMQGGGSQIGHLSGINYGSPVHSEGHGAPEGHKHTSENSDDYTFEAKVKTSNRNVSRKATRKQVKNLAEAAKQGYGGQAYSEGGSGTSVKIGKQPGNSRNILSVRKHKGGTTAGYGSEGPVYDEANKNVSRKDIKKVFKEHGSVTVKGGKAVAGTTLTKTQKGSVKRDTKKLQLANKKARLEGEKARASLEFQQARKSKKESLKEKKAAAIEKKKQQIIKRKADLQAARNARAESQKSKKS